jgi:amino acid adenylation domain-containing protein
LTRKDRSLEPQTLRRSRATGFNGSGTNAVDNSTLGFADHAATQPSTDLEYWRTQLAGEFPQLQLPFDRARTSKSSHTREVERFELPATLTQKLERLAHESGCPLYITILSTVAMVAQRYAGLDQIVIGGSRFEWNPGEFAEGTRADGDLLPLRVDFSDDPTFQNLQSRVQAVLVDATAHGNMLIAEILNAVLPGHDFHSNPPLNVGVSRLHRGASTAEFAAGHSCLDLNFSFQHHDARLFGTIEYDANLFDRSTINETVQHWQNLTAAACEDPAKPVSEFPILAGAERNRIVSEWNNTDAAYPSQCVHELFGMQAAKTPDLTAVVYRGESLNYRELNERANQVAHYLRNRGVGPEAIVGVCMNRTPEMVIALLGIWKAGGAYVPLDPAYPQERLSYMLTDSAAKFLLTTEEWKGLFPSAADKTILLDSDWPEIAKESSANPAPNATPSNLAYVMYTSGSTGEPKGAMILHDGLANYLTWAVRTYALEEGGSVPVHSSISFDLTVTSMYPALLAGGSIELLPEDAGAQSLLAALRRGGRNLVKITPAHLELLRQEIKSSEAAGMTKVFVIGGENLPAESLRLWREFAPKTRLINEYGPTETVVGCCVHEIRPEDPQSGSVIIGRPIANTQLYVLDQHRNLVPAGVAGELYIGGNGVARGYLNRPELTSQKFLPDTFSAREGAILYRTGDLARYRKNGSVEFLGRVDSQVKVRGYRIELGEIEAALMEHPGVKMCAVLAREDEPGDKQLVAYAAPADGSGLSVEELRQSLDRKLPKYMVPAHFVLLDSFPLTTNGKVDRKALRAPSMRRTESSESSFAGEFLGALLEKAANSRGVPARDRVRPQTETEKALIAIWSELLRVENPGVNDDFFNLGGHSLLVIKVISRIRDLFEVELPTQSLFEHPTIAGLAGVIAESTRAGASLRHIERRNVAGPSPLSFAQEELWFQNQLAPESPVYNVVDAIQLRGRYNADALQKTMDELARRHEALRTAFSFRDGRPVQDVLPEIGVSFREIDLGLLGREQRESEWKCVVEEEGRKTFDLSRAPLFRAAVVHLSGQEHKLLLTIHHIIADEWSMEILHDEITQLYQAFSHGRPSPLPELPIQYADFAAWQRDWLRGDALDAQAAHWKKELAGAPTVLDLPTDKPRPAVQSFRGATELFELPAELSEQLKSLGREQQATLFMILEAAFAVLLHRYTGRDDILVGTPISGRTRSETERLIGFFLNTVVLRAQFSERMNFRSFLRQVRERALRAYAHPDMPFGQLVAETATGRNASQSPIFQVMFVLHDAAGVSEVSKPSGNQELSTGTSKVDLTLVLAETANGLQGLFEYSTDLFEAATIRRMCGHFQTLLEAIAADPEQKISKLPMLTEAERRLQLTEWNSTAVAHTEMNSCLHHLIERQAVRTPTHVAQVFDGREMTYGELDQRANRLANHLRTFGIGPDQLVGVLVERSLDMLVTVLGILKAGGAYVPLDPSFPADRLGYMVEDSKMKVLVTHRGFEQTLSVRPSTIIRLDSDWEEIATAEAPAAATPDPSPTNLAYVLYTSGSTGKPKGVTVPHSAIVNFVLSMQNEPGFSEADTLLAVTTLSFDIAGLELWVPLIAGGKVVVASTEDAHDPVRLQDRIRQSRCTVMQATPATWRALTDSGWIGAPNLKILCGGEALPQDLAEGLLARSGELWNMYGPTETTVWSTLHRVMPGGAVSIGKPVANTQVYVLDKRMNLIPRGAVGELYIGGDGVARGYLHREELTRERFVPNPFVRNAQIYRTGDLARWLPDGTLECLGRTDSQVKIRGHRIELGEVELALATHAAVKQCVVIAREDAPGNRILAAYFVPRSATSTPAASDLRTHLNKALPEYMIPSSFVPMERLPLTPNGKVDRKSLQKPGDQPAGIDADSPKMRDALDQMLLQIWANVLGVKRVGLRDNFFDLGGHSLGAVQMMAEIRNLTGKALPLATLFQAPTVESLADILRQDGCKPSWSSLVPIRPQGTKTPLFLVHGAEGNVLLYRQVTQYLDPDRPVYGLQSQGLSGNAEFAKTIPELAGVYIKEIRTVQPHGPYHFGGYCLGGVIALEIAQQLAGAGETVESVILLETYNLKSLPSLNFHLWAPIRFLQNVWFHAANFFALRPGDRQKFLGEKIETATGRVGIRLKTAFQYLRKLGRPEARDDYPHLKVKKANDDAVMKYKPQPYDGRVAVIRPRCYFVGQNREDFGWGDVVRGDLEVVELPVYPKGILTEPFCRQSADAMNLFLRKG